MKKFSRTILWTSKRKICSSSFCLSPFVMTYDKFLSDVFSTCKIIDASFTFIRVLENNHDDDMIWEVNKWLTSLIAKLSKNDIFCGQIPEMAQSVSPSYWNENIDIQASRMTKNKKKFTKSWMSVFSRRVVSCSNRAWHWKEEDFRQRNNMSEKNSYSFLKRSQLITNVFLNKCI